MTTPILAQLPPAPPANLLLFSSQQWTWITNAIAAIYAAHEAELQTLGTLINSQEALLMAMNDLNTSQDRTKAATSAALAGIAQEIQQVKDGVAALAAEPTAAEVAAFKARIDANTDRLTAAVAALGADDSTATPPTTPA